MKQCLGLAIGKRADHSSGIYTHTVHIAKGDLFAGTPPPSAALGSLAARGGAAIDIYGHSKAGNYVDLCVEHNVLTILPNCPQMHNLCNAYNLTPNRVIIWRPR
jgi:hypothetical protein